jgi:uncharacterized protein YcbX
MADDLVVVKTLSLYPIKSLDPVVVSAARILPSGALEHDREFALFDKDGNRINGKRDARVHAIRAQYELPRLRVTLSADGKPPVAFDLTSELQRLEEWFGHFFGFPVFVRRNVETGFPDDLEANGPTIVGSASLNEVSSWFSLDPRETSRRFRANIELETESPFWEDCLFGEPETTLPFQIGDAAVHGVNPCQRCVVPSRDPSSGVSTADFQRTFAQMREETLPPWASKERFSHYYRLAVNTRIPATEAGKVLRCGDRVVIGSPQNAGTPSPR